MWYKLNIKKLSVLLLPPLLRKGTVYAFVFALIKPLEDIFYSWEKYRAENLYKLAHNSQVCYLRAALNDRFDPEQRRIIIVDGNRYKRNYIYTRAEQKTVYLGTLYLYQNSDYADTGVDFIVLVPSELLDGENYEMKALINYYKLASKRYKIEIL